MKKMRKRIALFFALSLCVSVRPQLRIRSAARSRRFPSREEARERQLQRFERGHKRAAAHPSRRAALQSRGRAGYTGYWRGDRRPGAATV